MGSDVKVDVISRCGKIIRRQQEVIRRLGGMLVLLTGDARYPALHAEAVRLARTVIDTGPDIEQALRMVEEVTGASTKVDVGDWRPDIIGPTMEV